MKKISKTAFLAGAAVIFVFSACSKNKEAFEPSFYAEGAVSANAAPRLMASKSKANGFYAMESDVVAPDESPSGNSEVQSVSSERKLIKTGGITLQVESLTEGEESVTKWSKDLGGYIANSNSSERNAYFTVKVPAENFDKAMETVGNLGIVRNRNMSTEDVSEQYYDLETRIASKKIMRDNFKRYLAQSTNMSDTLKIERELNNVLSDIESMEGRMRRLSGQIDYSTINVNLCLPEGKYSPEIHKPSLSENMKHFFSSVGSFFSGVLVVICYAVVCGLPVLALLVLLYWLLFGKVGLIRKLFRKLK